MKIKVSTKGNFEKTEGLLEKIRDRDPITTLNRLGQLGVELLSAATPKDTGLTASSWHYEIEKTGKGYDIHWLNSNVVERFSIALLIQYGHGTGTGGYVPGIDYINPVMDVLFKNAKIDIRKEVLS